MWAVLARRVLLRLFFFSFMRCLAGMSSLFIFLWHLFLFLVKQVKDSASKGVEGEEVFSEAKSLLFKSVKVVGVKTSHDHLLR